MGQLSIENIRKLNRAHLLAIEVPLPPGEGWGETDSAVKNVPAGKAPWHVSLYTSSGISLNGSVDTSAPMGDLLSKATSNKVVSWGMQAVGLSPQFDFSQKYNFMGTKPLQFSIQGALVLENDPTTDYIIPLKRLAYLTYPARALPVSLDALFEGISAAVKALDADRTKLGSVLMNVRSNLGALLNASFSDLNWTESSAKGDAGWDQINSFMAKVLGKMYAMVPPPTFDWFRSGSGLDFKYGNTLISDVYIRSFNVQVPTLYFEGGWPPYMQVSLELGTFRNMTYDLFNSIIQGMPQSYEQLEEEKALQLEMLKARYGNSFRGSIFEFLTKEKK